LAANLESACNSRLKVTHNARRDTVIILPEPESNDEMKCFATEIFEYLCGMLPQSWSKDTVRGMLEIAMARWTYWGTE
jgi:hypothetical protein